MLQSIQYNGSGPPTYVYAKKAVGASMEYYQVFAAETRGYNGNRQSEYANSKETKEEKVEPDAAVQEEFKVIDASKKDNLLDVYKKEYGRRESFLWKLR